MIHGYRLKPDQIFIIDALFFLCPAGTWKVLRLSLFVQKSLQSAQLYSKKLIKINTILNFIHSNSAQ